MDGKVDKEKVPRQGKNESGLLLEIVIPFLFAGCGLSLAGLVLNHVQHWPVFQHYPDFFVLVPTLLGLKGNLEMTLASRLCSIAGLGHLDHPTRGRQTLLSNLALVQFQGIVVGGIASLIPISIRLLWHHDLTLSRIILVSSSSIVTASIASFLLGVIMIAVIEGSRKKGLNPDNIATPIAASLGDVLTLIILSYTASGFMALLQSFPIALGLINLFYLVILPYLFIQITKCEDALAVFYSGWTPVLIAMLISSLGGKVLNLSIKRYPHIASYQPLINGVAGNLVAVQASRISSWLHAFSNLGHDPKDMDDHESDKIEADHGRTARILLSLVVPGHVAFILLGAILQGRWELDWSFIGYFLLASLLQVSMLLYVAEKLTLWLWKMRIDPDNASIPYLTALGDLLGGIFLTVASHLNE
ncbi:hypothetical protein TCAL_04282 [Tigriopus californicus]|uniref:SLC41A/MgtE integral membrane domain-containing protein n=1 Tax=Tigriopus californicus TaxID=6832 RepID=A0A553NFY1_TIGCA|nr:solute carrier family 41 member 1-like [Tigriopus californicus]XP_059093849.1 solute carrier family 41 member 1-like [Tigriopus californicus]XP_059093850.1 solute carrier family 41 member 1-like [Tigriopus californicus]TRY64356.1 hypothetical protein TCAL_04282 [Tigriopus californicus]|eukprot:TCALIF_04282-PA protein Name:"Similar to slc41a2 Solute carrier family 41 member 2 (Xenopus laevis)" AED:0.02 eAED:0.02 QI:33/1/1/1/1/1/4/236/416